jgi:fluoride exporter
MARLYGARVTRAAQYVAVGGVVGSLTRWLVLNAMDRPTLALLIVNVVGSALLGVVVVRWPRADDRKRLALGVGFCGGLTTFSSFALDVAWRLEHSDISGATSVTVSSLVLSIPAYLLARRVAQRPEIST